MKCDFYRCKDPATGHRQGKNGRGLTFCADHERQLEAAWLKGTEFAMRFWQLSKGGARKARKSEKRR